jgi:hypothetical protein
LRSAQGAPRRVAAASRRFPSLGGPKPRSALPPTTSSASARRRSSRPFGRRRVRRDDRAPAARPGARDLQAIEQRQQSFERTLPTPERERLQPQPRELDQLRERARRSPAMDAELLARRRTATRRAPRALERDIDRLELEAQKLRSP